VRGGTEAKLRGGEERGSKGEGRGGGGAGNGEVVDA